MSANEINREELIAMLAWQVGCGADEAISDQPIADQTLHQSTDLSVLLARGIPSPQKKKEKQRRR